LKGVAEAIAGALAPGMIEDVLFGEVFDVDDNVAHF
jgi:hypothetical protein